MARYKPYDLTQMKLIPVSYADQILPGTFEHTLCRLVDEELNLSAFDEKFRNDANGAPAYDPRVLLKVVLFAYSKGITSSRRIARACRQNVVFMALSGDSQPHFSTIAEFICGNHEAVQELFRRILLVCDEMGLIGEEMFAVDGMKLPSNASKAWSGTRADFQKKVEKLDGAIRHMLDTHQRLDASESEEPWVQREQQQIETLRKHLAKIERWLADHDTDRVGPSGKPVQSNLTDPDSAKMKTAKGVIQGYNAIAAVDAKHQIIVAAEVEGAASERHLLLRMTEQIRGMLASIRPTRGPLPKDRYDPFRDAGAMLSADAGFHTNAAMLALEQQGIDALIADNRFRSRDPRFQEAKRHKPPPKPKQRFDQADFQIDPEQLTCRCPAGKSLYLKNRRRQTDGRINIRFQAPASACRGCALRAQCLRSPAQATPRSVYYFTGEQTTKTPEQLAAERMQAKLDSPVGRAAYGQRLGTVEPVFGNINTTFGLNRFTLRGKPKVNAQWHLFSIVHNIGKLNAFAPGFT